MNVFNFWPCVTIYGDVHETANLHIMINYVELDYTEKLESCLAWQGLDKLQILV